MYKYIRDKSELDMSEFFQGLGGTMVISLDTEATSTDPITARWILLQVKLMDTIYLFDTRTLDKKFLIYIVSLLKSSQKTIIAHNSKYDLKLIYLETDVLLDHIHDTMLIESFLYKGIGKVFYSLAELVEFYCGEILDKDIRKSFEGFIGDLSNEQLTYAAKDVLYLETIFNKQMKLVQEKGLDRVYKLEMDIVPVLVVMELTGVYLDKQEWLDLETNAKLEKEISYKNVREVIFSDIDFTKYGNGVALANAFCIPVTGKARLKALESITDTSLLKEWLAENININSSKQLLAILTGVYGMKLESTDEKVLKDIVDDKIIPHILRYRGYNKKITTYGEDFLKHIHPVTGRIHSEFLQNGTTSGRFS